MYRMDRRLAKEFGQKVQMLLEDDDERDALFQALKRYKQEMSVEQLIADLKVVLNNPKRMILYEEIRPLIPLKHQMNYDRYVPKQPSEKIRVVRLIKQSNETFGFSIRGGVEHAVGIFVSDVIPDSQASIKGLKVGDQVVRVNGFNISQATHDEVLALIHSKRSVTLKVKTVGMVPEKNKKNDPLTWKYVESSAPSMLEDVIKEAESGAEDDIRKLYVNLIGGMTLGCSIASTPGKPDIFIQYVKPHSLAEQIGIKPGDQILEVNGVSFVGITHAEAVVVLKSSKQLTITLKKGGADFEIYAKPNKLRRAENDSNLGKQQEELKRLRQIALQNEREKQRRMDKDRADADRKIKEEKAQYEKNKARVASPSDDTQRKEEEKWQDLWMVQPKGRSGNRVSQSSLDAADLESEQIAQELYNLSLQQEKEIEKEKQTGTSAMSLQDQWNAQRDDIEQEMEVAKRRVSSNSYQKQTEHDLPNFTTSMKVHLKPTGHTYASYRLGRHDTDANFNPRIYFTDREIGGKEIRLLQIKKDGPLEIVIEGGIDSPIGKIVVSEVYDGGAAHRHGGLYKGDQIMMVDNKKTTAVKLAEAEKIIADAMKNTDGSEILELVIAVAPPKNYEDEITFF
ncbi:harmonin-like isoform X2 [Ptychodera flava]|uniref:harmonin-like isoform X2 n=1 Tax=Ptychodera flava TaxID=63121 RepID=UPI00396A49D6